MPQITRRGFIRRTSQACAGLLAYPMIRSSAEIKSRVIMASHEDAVINGSIQPEIVQQMVNASILELSGESSLGAAWKSLFPNITAQSVVGIKVNTINSKVPSHPEVAYAIANGLMSMEIGGQLFPANQIVIWDRYKEELEEAGYDINRSGEGVQVYATNQSGAGYHKETHWVTGTAQRLSNILKNHCDYLINLCVLKNHGTAGVTLSMKNHYGTCNSPGDLHDNYCNPAIAELNALEPIRQKQVLCVCDALFGIISGGPGGKPQVTPKRIFMSTDTVALDAVGKQLLYDYKCSTTGRATYISKADQLDLGTSKMSEIEIVEIHNPVTDVHDGPDVPQSFQLNQNFPNPFNGQTSLVYSLKQDSYVTLEVLNVRGQVVHTLYSGMKPAGVHSGSWDGSTSKGTAASGTYIARLRWNKGQKSIRMQLIQ